MQILGLAGWSGSGKTTLLKKLIPELIDRDVSVSTIKHAHHRFDIDTPGKDSYEHRWAGATEVMVTSSSRWALIHENRDKAEPDIDTLVNRMAKVDFLLIEGFKNYLHEKIEVHRAAIGKPLLSKEDSSIIAIVTDNTLANINLPLLNLEDIPGIADFILTKFGKNRC